MSNSSNNILGDITPEEFLKTYWQKKPLLIRQAIPGYQCPVTPEELAGLACEDSVESRLVIKKGGKSPWQVKHGPLANKDFKKLPASHWTLLVQRVDHFDPRIANLLDHFRFIPNWRIDDVMISYAPEHGSVGPHLDSYDVFLLQGMGRRRWQINRRDYSTVDFIPDLDLRILREFQPEEEWILEPGDMLYLPPGVAHHGIALEPCLTLSIGFLAPKSSELIQHYTEEMITDTKLDQRYTDADLSSPKHATEISAENLGKLREMMQATLSDETMINRWLGQYLTRAEEQPESANAKITFARFKSKLNAKTKLRRDEKTRTAFIKHKKSVDLFINGECYSFSKSELPLVQLISEQRCITAKEIKQHKSSETLVKFLYQMYQRGIYYLNE